MKSLRIVVAAALLFVPASAFANPSETSHFWSVYNWAMASVLGRPCENTPSGYGRSGKCGY